jgi:hypothetical protein
MGPPGLLNKKVVPLMVVVSMPSLKTALTWVAGAISVAPFVGKTETTVGGVVSGVVAVEKTTSTQ